MTRRAFVTVCALFLACAASLIATTRRLPTPPGATVPAPTARASRGAVALAQRSVTPATDTPRRPVLLVREGEEPSRPIALEAADYAVTVAGLVARTRVTLTFRNDMPRVLEGEFVYPLPEGAVLSGFALDVAGQMMDGVVVEAQRARVAFETEVRKGIDPGLVEWVRGNNFRTRVWPVPARGRRTVRLEYISELVDRADGSSREASYELPLRFGTTIDQFSLRVEVVRTDLAPVVRSGLANFAFAQWQDRYVAEATRTNVSPDDLVIALPRVPRIRRCAPRGVWGGGGGGA